MARHAASLALVCAFLTASPAPAQDKQASEKAGRQEKPAASTAASLTDPNDVPLRVEIVMSRYQGQKKVSGVPYTFSVTPGRRASLRSGAQIPIISTTFVRDGGPSAPSSFQYKNFGTSIDCSASRLNDGRYKLEITIDDSSVYAAESSAPALIKTGDAPPPYRSFVSSDVVILHDGESSEYTSAVERVGGEMMKVGVTLHVLK